MRPLTASEQYMADLDAAEATRGRRQAELHRKAVKRRRAKKRARRA